MNADRSHGHLWAGLAALVVGAGLAAGPAVADTALTVGKAAPTSDNLIVVDVGNELGFFKQHGLDLKILNFRGTAPLVQAMTAGSLDIALADGTMMAFIVKGAPMTAVCQSTTALPMMSIGVPYDSPVRSLAELKGKKIGISGAGLTDWVVQELERTQGWEPGGITRVKVGAGPAQSAAAFRTHQIDASVEGTTSFLIEEKEKVARILALVSSFTNIDIGGVYASSHLIQSDPDAVRAFIAAWIETDQFIMTHKEGTIRALDQDHRLSARDHGAGIRSRESHVEQGLPLQSGFDRKPPAFFRRAEDPRQRARHVEALYRSLSSQESRERGRTLAPARAGTGKERFGVAILDGGDLRRIEHA